MGQDVEVGPAADLTPGKVRVRGAMRSGMPMVTCSRSPGAAGTSVPISRSRPSRRRVGIRS